MTAPTRPQRPNRTLLPARSTDPSVQTAAAACNPALPTAVWARAAPLGTLTRRSDSPTASGRAFRVGRRSLVARIQIP